MFGFIKNLVKKSDKSFYLELKDDEGTKPAEASNGSKPAALVPAPVAEAPAPTTVNSNGKATKKEIATAAKAAKIQAAKEEKKVETARVLDAAEIVAAAVAKKPEVATEKNFATKYLLTNGSNSRRRPGANMNAFLEMARTAKTPMQK
jgi:hypothetical protein